ncbi:NUDIX hydrolase [Actinoplanes sp. NPDC051494]|uniref:NUDIX hydrolase n=1 Tax=Actinoplanes sp. NPDC051494 TaxID=3363907 RepID=UPI0037BC9E76
MTGAIRPIALAAAQRGDDLLVFEGLDRPFYRPLGGGIEFGETAVAALHREMREELAVDLSDVKLLGVLENIFTTPDGPGHEIAFIFTATLADPAMYARDTVGTVLDDGSPVTWQPKSRFRSGEATLYPDGLIDLLR